MQNETMFRRLRDQVSSAADAASAALGIGDEKVRALTDLGYDAETARHALAATDGNVERAAELLLLSGSAPQRNQPPRQQQQQRQQPSAGTAASPIDVDDDDQVRRIMEESRRAEEERRIRAAREESLGDANINVDTDANANINNANRTAAMANAGRAALARFEGGQTLGGKNKGGKKKAHDPVRRSNTAPPAFDRPTSDGGVIRMKSSGLTAHHPDVKVPKRMGDKTKEEQLLRCADRLRPHPFAVDTLLVALRAIRDDPDNERYRKVDKTTAGYVRTLKDRPGAEDMLLAMNFRRHGPNELRLDRPMVDDALLYLGISALEKVRESDEYKDGKRKARFVKELDQIRRGAGNDSEAEAVRRAAFMAKCPSEPTGGAGALIQLRLGDDVVRRRFDGDDVLKDIVHWIGGHGSAIPDKLASRDWCLVDINRYPPAPIDTVKNAEKTLQFIGCWPSGRLEVQPSPDDWKEQGAEGGGGGPFVAMGSSRGLGSAPTSELT
mmetsp:Transcript_23080/g.48031  ORF Transcript_23080/g.48031 Transcript_23080/m.48031 type:complete len:497 (+) Transcript_23080:95-1585(+)